LKDNLKIFTSNFSNVDLSCRTDIEGKSDRMIQQRTVNRW